MADSLPPDPYLALGVAKDANAAVIKAQYRKLALKFHPDKVQDASQKELASDQFHKIQTAWEIVGNETRRQRYDAQCRLVELRKDVMERSGGPRSPADMRSSAPPPPSSQRRGDYYPRESERSGRVSPAYEERRPSYAAQQDYYDVPPRATARKEPEYERSSKRTPPRNERERTKASQRDSKESERSGRREKTKRTEKEIRRDRDRKQPVYSSVEEASSDSDEYARARRRRTREEEQARANYHEQARRQQAEAFAGQYADERARKIFSQEDVARDHIQRSNRPSRPRVDTNTARRPSPVRMNSSTSEKVEYISREGGRPPVMIRRGSGRPKTTGRDMDEQRPRRSSTRDTDIVDEPEPAPRPPPFVSSKSSPSDIRKAFEGRQEARQRSQSAQIDQDAPAPAEKPRMRRADSMPVERTVNRDAARDMSRETRRKDTTMPTKSSGLRGEPKHAYPTPEHSPEPPPTSSRRRRYERETYSNDEADYVPPQQDSYRASAPAAASIEQPREREPSFRAPRYTRSPSPMREARPRPANVERSTSNINTNPAEGSRPQHPTRTTSTSYPYPDPRGASGSSGDSYSPRSGAPPGGGLARENSARSNLLYGEYLPSVSPRGSRRASPHDRSAASPGSAFPTSPPGPGTPGFAAAAAAMEAGFGGPEMRSPLQQEQEYLPQKVRQAEDSIKFRTSSGSSAYPPPHSGSNRRRQSSAATGSHGMRPGYSRSGSSKAIPV